MHFESREGKEPYAHHGHFKAQPGGPPKSTSNANILKKQATATDSLLPDLREYTVSISLSCVGNESPSNISLPLGPRPWAYLFRGSCPGR